MQKVYFIRHRNGHVNTEVLFLSPPSNEQRDAVLAHDDQIYGPAKDDESFHRDIHGVVEAVLIEGGEVPQFDDENHLVVK